MNDLDEKTAAALARLDARADPTPEPAPAALVEPSRTVLSDLRLVVAHVAGPGDGQIEFATFGGGEEAPLAEALPILLRDTANAILALAQSGARWPKGVFAAAKTAVHHFEAMAMEVERSRVAKAAADLKAKGVS